jgi:riboflavin transporter FmnP
MQTKKLTLIIVFIALTVALNVAGPKIPAPYAPFLVYQLWEIPIVVAFLAIGPLAGLTITTVNTLILLVAFPGSLPTGPLYNFIAVLAMLLGVYLPYKIATRKCPKETIGDYLKSHIKALTIAATILGITLRVLVTTPTNYIALQLTYPFGFGLNAEGAVALLPFIAFFNATVALYTIPIAIAITAAILSKFKI